MKKHIIFLIYLSIFVSIKLNAQVKVGDNPTVINTSALIEMESTTKGLILPRLTTLQRDAIITPANGLLIYNTTTNNLDIYKTNRWVPIIISGTETASTLPATPNTGEYIKIGDHPNTISPNTLIEIESINRGILLPRLTDGEMYAIATPALGLIIFNTTQNNVCVYKGTSWDCLIGCSPTTALAGSDQSLCGTTATLAGNQPTIGTGQWTIMSGVGGSFNDSSAYNSTFTGITGNTYTLRWTISNPPCVASSDNVDITFTPNNTITLTSAAGTNAQTVCINTAITPITYATTRATGATFSGLPSGVSGSWAANVVTISGSPSTTTGSPFTYTVTLTGGCGTVTSTGTITVTPNNTISLTSAAGTNAQTVCINTAITPITYATTRATGATFSGLPSGVSGSWAANVVTISGSPNTTTGSPFTYTVTLTGGCGTVTATGTITVTSPISQEIAGTTPLCVGGTDTWTSTTAGGTWTSATPAVATINSSSGLVTGVSSGTSVITYSVTTTGGCVNTATKTVTITGGVPQTITGTTPLCIGGTDTWTSTTAGGTWTSATPTRATVNSSSGLVAGVSAGTSVITYSVTTTGGCVNTATKTVTITAPIAQTISGTTPLCIGKTDTWTSTTSGGTWTSATPARATVNSSSGLVTGVSAGTSVITYSVTTTGGCVNTATKTVTINAIPTITGTTPNSRCGSGTVVLGATASAGTINWYSHINSTYPSDFLGTGTTYTTPIIPANRTYYVDATANSCTTGTRTSVTATVNTIPALTTALNGIRCGTGSVNIGVTDVPFQTTIDWYANPTGGLVLSGGIGTTSFNTPNISSTTTYYAESRVTTTGCVSSTRRAVTATVNPAPVAGTISANPGSGSTVCVGSNITYTASGYSGTQNFLWSRDGSNWTDDPSLTGTWNWTSNGANDSYLYVKSQVKSGVCTAVNSNTVNHHLHWNPTTANAGSDINLSGGEPQWAVGLNANTPSVGTGVWTKTSGPTCTITSPNDPGALFETQYIGTYTLRWTISNSPCNDSYDEVIIICN